MGGSAFSQVGKHGEPVLNTPRLEPAKYIEVRDKYLTILTKFYEKVVAPFEAPGKKDHGDVDILVEGLRDNVEPKKLAVSLGARRYFTNGRTTSYGIALSEEDNTYFQLDIHLCRTGFLEWECFMNNYGDLWQIVGMMQRNVGLTATDRGFHVRIPEIERDNRKVSMIYLSHSPEEVLEFLGLDREKYNTGFQSEDEIFMWCTGGRFFQADTFEVREETANDRQRMKQRVMFRRFITEWLPAHAELNPDREEWTREAVLHEALKAFGQQEEYDRRMKAWEAAEKEKQLWRKIAKTIPKEGEKLGQVMRSLKRWVWLNQDKPQFREKPLVDLTSEPLWTSQIPIDREDDVISWICANWDEASQKEKSRAADEKADRIAKRKFEASPLEQSRPDVAVPPDYSHETKRTTELSV